MNRTRTAAGARIAPKELEERLLAFVVERAPLALATAREAWDDAVQAGASPRPAIRSIRRRFLARFQARIHTPDPLVAREVTPGVSASERLAQEERRLIEDLEGFFDREMVRASITKQERREILRGMLLTRATDNRLKAFFSGSEVRYGAKSFQGKGFRSLGQEAIYASAMRLRRGKAYRAANAEGGANADGGTNWNGDVVAPLIRDLGAALAMNPAPETVRMVLSAQMAKAGPPMNGKDLHIGDLAGGILPAAAPLSISTLTAVGMAMGFQLAGEDRVAVSYIGEGGSSLGEWHEAINLAAARRLPAIFCVQNNQTALSTPVPDQSAVRVFADKAIGYGIPGLTIDGTDPEAILAAFAWAAERARAGHGPALIELVAMRMCGHAHHDDMLYLGREPKPSWDYPPLASDGYADRAAYDFWAGRDPIPYYAAKLEGLGVLKEGEIEKLKREAEEIVENAARAVIDAEWPDASGAGAPVFANEPPRVHVDPLANDTDERTGADASLPPVEDAPPFDPGGATFLEAVMAGVGDALDQDERAFVYGQDVGGKYGNAFMLLRPLLARHGDRILNATLAEGGIIGVCVGAALAGRRPIGEIQFNDFVATGFNQLVNNAAKIRYRWGGEVPMVLRMPWGGLRSAGPYHSQNTEPWFYRTPGLKIVVPSTPHDARALLLAALRDPDPVLYYEHIGLYRDPSIRQSIDDAAQADMPLGKAALRRAGSDLALVSYGAYVHLASRVADRLARDGHSVAVLDLRSLVPLDREALLAVTRHCGKVMIVQEDAKTGGIGESLASKIQEEAFEDLDAPVRVVGALDTPVPYSPPLEAFYLAGEESVYEAAKNLLEY